MARRPGLWPRTSQEIVSLLQPVGTLAGLLLTEQLLDLRHPLCLMPSVPALDTAVDAEPSEEYKARGTPQCASQERGLLVAESRG